MATRPLVDEHAFAAGVARHVVVGIADDKIEIAIAVDVAESRRCRGIAGRFEMAVGSISAAVLTSSMPCCGLKGATASDKQFWTHAALIFTTIYAVFASANYVVQLATVVPAKSRGIAEGSASSRAGRFFAFARSDL